MDDDEIREAVASLETATVAEKRIAALQNLEGCLQRSSEIHNTAEVVSNALRTQLRHANPLVAAKALSTVPIFVDRLTSDVSDVRRATHTVRHAVQTFVPLMIERLGDHRERTRDGAKAVLIQLVRVAGDVSNQQVSGGQLSAKQRPADDSPLSAFETAIVESGLRSKIAKVREVVTLVLPVLRQEAPRLHLRPFLSTLVDHLSDADAGVRESARSVIVTLFASASPMAKSELRKEMDRKAVRKVTQDSILAQVLEKAGLNPEKDLGIASGRQTPASMPPFDDAGPSGIPSRSGSRLGVHAAPTATSGIATAPDVRPVYVTSAFELDKIFTSMIPHFNGKESEHNWQTREQSVIKLRGMLNTNVHESFPGHFQTGIQKLAEPILKAVASLRTTLCMHGITLVTELAQRLGDDLGGVAETFFTALFKMAGFTKKIVATASQFAVKEILSNTSYKVKYLEQVGQGVTDKNPVTRSAVIQHFITILNVHARYRKHALEAHAGIELITNMCKKALTDANKDVRALGREAFYRVEEVWPSIGASIISCLDPTSLKLVESNRKHTGQSAFAHEILQVQKSTMPERPSSRLASVASPRTPRTPANRSGPSNALLTAKKAAAARMAEQRRNEEVQREAAAAEEKRQTAAREESPKVEDKDDSQSLGQGKEDEDIMSEEEVFEEELEEQRRLSPPPSLKRKTDRATPSAVVTPSRSSRQNTPSIQPSSIPLPVSPSSTSSSLKRPSSMMLLASRPRTNSTSSVSSNRSVGRLNLAASGQYGSIAQRFEQSPSQSAAAAREARMSSSSMTQTPSRSHLGFKATPSPALRWSPQPAVPALGTDGMHRGDISQVTVDDDLATSFNASLHFNTPSARPSNRHSVITPKNSTGKMSRSMTDDRLNSHALSSPPPSSASGSATRRSRPASMIPSPRTPSNTLLPRSESSTRLASVGGGVSAATRQAAMTSYRAQLPADASRGTKWFLGKANRLENMSFSDESESEKQLSPVKRRPESGDHIAQLAGGRATLLTFKSLVALSKDFKLPDRPNNESILDIDDYEQARKISSANAMAKFEYDLAVAMWQEEGLFDRLFTALSTYLQRDAGQSFEGDNRDLQTAALVLLHRVVDNQFGLFAALGRETDLFALLLDVSRRSANARASAAADVKNACQAISDRWCKQTDVVVGISVVRLALSPLLSESNGTEDAKMGTTAVQETKKANDPIPTTFTASTQVLAFKSLAILFARLPAEVIEEQMDHCKALVRFGLNHRQIEVRQQAVKVIVAANKILRDPQSIFGILQPIDKAQQDLLVYYMSKS